MNVSSIVLYFITITLMDLSLNVSIVVFGTITQSDLLTSPVSASELRYRQPVSQQDGGFFIYLLYYTFTTKTTRL